jgi:DNA helicase-2/ATP-dependent DNA helicase PcrA
MATKTIQLTPVGKCKLCIKQKNNFVLQGGAGSGKTETLKELLMFVKNNQPAARVVCITHTNVAVDEIASRVGDGFIISTIHSFINSIIKDYKKNIKTVISNVFVLEEMNKFSKVDSQSDADYKKAEHARYKKIYEKYASSLFDMRNETVSKCIGKKEYDSNPDCYNEALNVKIRELNTDIEQYISEYDYTKIKYNETVFNSYKEVTFGHDGLLEVFHLLFKKYHVLQKLIKDKFDYIFIDEYQDSNEDIIDDLLSISNEPNLTVALFGDSMQAIYKDGIGGVNKYITDGVLIEIEKPDNFRCSYEVIDMINLLRLDGIRQQVEFKKLSDGELETEADRHGETKVLYSVCEFKPHSRSAAEEKQEYQDKIEELINYAVSLLNESKVLMLTNKSIAKKNQFENLYEVFDERYADVSDRLENYLKLIQVIDICEICHLYKEKKYNPLLKRIRSAGFLVKTVSDKAELKTVIEHLTDTNSLSIVQAIAYAKEKKLIKETETYSKTVARNNEFLKSLQTNTQYNLFKKLYNEGNNTYTRINAHNEIIKIRSEEEFDCLKRKYKQEKFINVLFSNEIKFSEALKYFEYLNEETNCITMHKTKGSSISNVIVVMEEFFWNEYDFSLMYSAYESSKQKIRENSQKLIYVACSRAKNSIICLKMLSPDEVDSFKAVFPNAICFKDYTSCS